MTRKLPIAEIIVGALIALLMILPSRATERPAAPAPGMEHVLRQRVVDQSPVERLG